MNELRPKTLDDIIGQRSVIERLKISIRGAEERGESLGHILLNASPGLGKTTFAYAIANSMGVEPILANAGNMRSLKNLLPYLMKIKDGSILFIDEIHRLPMHVEEFLYTVMEDFRVDIGGEGAVSFSLPFFCLIGATTLGGQLSKPLYDRFIHHYDLEPYTNEDIEQIILASSRKMNLTFERNAVQSLSGRCRGVPRIANNYLLWMRDYAHSGRISLSTVNEGMKMLGVDESGLTAADRKYLKALETGQPMGLSTLASTTDIDRDTIQGVIEPYLLRLNLIQKTPKGRILTNEKV